MKNLVQFLSLFVILSIVVSCKSTSNINFDTVNLADKNANSETKKLFLRIENIAKEGIAFGHQDATAYGIGWKHKDDPSRIKSDVKEVTGKFPAVHGFDLGHIELGRRSNLDTVSFELMKNHVIEMHKEGAIITFSWHLDNPVSEESSWDTTPAVSQLLKRGEERQRYEIWIRRLSDFFKSLKDENGNFIPVVFRPYHEMNGGWFWWGAGNCTPEEYKQLWRETLDLLSENNVHNLLYAFSPNTIRSREEFELYYPGDEYVDILGVDIYNHGGNEQFTIDVRNNLEILKEISQTNNKPYVLSESGNNNNGVDANWWTQVLYPGIKDTGIAWALFWRNYSPDHYFATYPGEISEEDFREFEELEEILFLDEIEEISFK